MFGGLFGGGEKLMHPAWMELSTLDQLNKIKEDSYKKTQVLFKHSTRCSISSMAYNRLEKGWDEKSEAADFHYLDLIRFREVSNAIASMFSVHHESPQLLVIKNGVCERNASHNQVSADLVG